MQRNLPVLVPVRLIESEPPIDAAQMPDGHRGAALRSLCAWLDVDKSGQVARIRRNPALSAALVLMVVDTPGGPQPTDVLQAWAIPVWASGLHTSRLPEKKRALALILQQEAFAAIERAFTELEERASAAPSPSQSAVPQSSWEIGHAYIDSLKADNEDLRQEFHTAHQELQNRVALVEHEQHAQALRVAALEAGDVRSAMGSFSQRLVHIYVLARQLRQRRGYRVADTLAGLADHFRVEDVSDLAETDWPAALVWFESLLER